MTTTTPCAPAPAPASSTSPHPIPERQFWMTLDGVVEKHSESEVRAIVSARNDGTIQIMPEDRSGGWQPASSFGIEPPPPGSAPRTAASAPDPDPSPGSTPPEPFPFDPLLHLQQVDRDQIKADAAFYHRVAPDQKRIERLASRMRHGAHFPPIVLFEKPDGSLLVVDGLQRLIAFDTIGITPISCVVCKDLPTALVAGIRQNRPKDGKLRSGEDAFKALCLLATALKRKLSPAEATSLGLQFNEHHFADADALKNIYSRISVPAPKASRQPVKSNPKPPKRPKKQR